ncbi:hypothetical protein KUTeg_004645, partial [Tegillarca granosa]
MPVVDLTDESDETIRVLNVDGYNLAVWLPATNQEEEFRTIPTWKARSDDVIICAYPKAGTHWLWEIISMLYNGKANRIWENKEIAMMEFLSLKEYDDLPSPRILNTHLFFHQLPTDTLTKKPKLVFIQRNPRNIAVSFYHHHKKIVMYNYDGKWENYFNRFLNGNIDFGSWFEYTLDWETTIKEHPELPIHVMYFENLKQNGIEEIQRLADFLGVNANKKLITAIEEMCQFSTMKKDKDQMELLEISRDKKPLFYRKGEIGDWKNWFTVAQSEKFDEVMKEKTKASDTK